MKTLFKNMVVAVVGAAASYYASKIVEQYLSEKPLKDRMTDWKDTAQSVQIKIIDGVLNAADDLKKRVR